MEGARQHHNVTLAFLALAGLAYALQQTMIVPALPSLQHDLHTSTAWATWLLTAFLLVSAVATPVLGKLGGLGQPVEAVDELDLTTEERERAHLRARSRANRELIISLPRGEELHDGDVVYATRRLKRGFVGERCRTPAPHHFDHPDSDQPDD